MNIVIEGSVDLESAIQAAVENLVPAVDGVGPDFCTSYEVTDCTVTVDGVNFTIDLTLGHVEGKFASRDDVGSAIIDLIDTVEVTDDALTMTVAEPARRPAKPKEVSVSDE